MGGLARWVTRHPIGVLLVSLVFVLAAGVVGRNAPGSLSPAGYEVSGSESTLASSHLAEQFDTGPANLLLLIRSDDPDGVDSDSARADGLALGQLLGQRADVSDVTSYWTTGAEQLRSADRSQALITARIVADEDVIYDRVEAIREEFAGPYASVAVEVGGSGPVNLEVVEESERDLLRAELIAIPVTTIVMLIVFRSVVAALLPLLVSAVAVAGTAATLRGLSDITLVSVFGLNLTTALGLGMGVDYSLFMLSRWREERAAGREPTEAVETALVVAGRPILFSALTTAATLAALLLFDYPLLRSLAFAGFVVVTLAAVGALIALPAAMTLLGDRIDRWSIRRPAPKPIQEGWWYRVAKAVMRHPVATIVATVSVLLLLGSPFLRAEFGLPDDRVLPPASPSRQVSDQLRSNFEAKEFGALAAVAPDWSRATLGLDQTGPQATGATYARHLSAIDGVERVDTAAGVFVAGERVAPTSGPDRFLSDGGLWFSIIPTVEPISGAGEELVATIRATPAPTHILVGGESARLVDNKAEIMQKVPFVLLWVAVVIAGLLYSSFGSLLLPIKAFVLNLLSLTAAFGAIVWIFQDGRFSDQLGFTPTGLTDVQTPVLIFCIAFGLSMDYEVFLLSRIKEEWEATGDNREAVAIGLQRTGGLITAAAVLMAVVFLAFASGNVTFIQMVGIGLALSIIVDATLVRTLLVPAFMVLSGKWNWWSPTLSKQRTSRAVRQPIAESTNL